MTYGEAFLDAVSERFPAQHDVEAEGTTFGEFMAGPVRAARLQFARRWDQQMVQAGESVRTVFVVSPALGLVVFFGVLIGPSNVEIAGFDIDPDYWDTISVDPD